MEFLVLLVLANCVTVSWAGPIVGSFHRADDTDPSEWPTTYPFCGGLNQSPVDICTDKVHPNPTLGNIVYTNFNTKFEQNLELINFKGEQAQLRNLNHSITIREGGLPARLYRLEQLHFHVGSTDNRGSEHDIDGKFFPAEMHLVFYSDEYTNITDSINSPQGVAVLTVLFKVCNEDNNAYEPIIEKLCDIKLPDETVAVEPLKIRDLLPEDIDHFYRYRGSLTTPPCYQSVIWTIYKDLGKISERQLEVFRTCMFTDESLYGDHTHHVINNFRPVQPLNGRLIEENKDAWSPIHCDNDNGNDNNGRDSTGRNQGPARCNDRSNDNGWKYRPDCYEDKLRNDRNNGKDNGKDNGFGNGRNAII